MVLRWGKVACVYIQPCLRTLWQLYCMLLLYAKLVARASKPRQLAIYDQSLYYCTHERHRK